MTSLDLKVQRILRYRLAEHLARSMALLAKEAAALKAFLLSKGMEIIGE